MAFRRSRKPRRAGRGKRPARRMRRSNIGKYTQGEFASAKQTIRLDNDATNAILLLDDVNLSQFDRLTAIAKNYQFFRMSKITIKFLPFSDTFAASGATGEAVPYLHYLIDTGEVLMPVTGTAGFNQLRDSGAKPIRFDDKTITVNWSPRVPVATASSSASPPDLSYAMATRRNCWLPTNNAANNDPFGWVPSTVPHKGIYYGVEQQYSTSPGERIYGVEITVHCQFRKPLMVAPNGVAEPAKKKLVKPIEDVVVVSV